MTRRTVIRVGSTITVFILFGLIGGIFLNTLLTSAANSPLVAPVSTPSLEPTPEPTTDPVVAPTPSEDATRGQLHRRKPCPAKHVICVVPRYVRKACISALSPRDGLLFARSLPNENIRPR